MRAFLVTTYCLLDDMKPILDPANYGGFQGRGADHYLIKLIHQILTNLDRNSKGEKNAILLELYDWSKAYDMNQFC